MNIFFLVFTNTKFFPEYTGCSKKTLFYVFAYISANTYHIELAWQEASNDMRLDFLRYLVHEKIDILCEILTPFLKDNNSTTSAWIFILFCT